MEQLNLTQEWDKTFPKSEKVNHRKITFVNRFWITLAADLYEPKEYEWKLPAIAVSWPFWAIKEQCSWLYAQTMAERWFLTIAFDPSYTWESWGIPRYVASPDINTEDFQAAVDFLSIQDNVDPEKIGIIWICGWWGLALNTAALDTRIKATIAVTMYDMSSNTQKWYFNAEDSEESRYQKRLQLAKDRNEDAKNWNHAFWWWLPEVAPEWAPDFLVNYVSYYKHADRWYVTRSVAWNEGWAKIWICSYLNTKLLSYANEIRTPVLLIHWEKAHSLYMSQEAYKLMTENSKYADNKELMIIPWAVHIDLYDNLEVIPFDKMEEFFNKYL